MPIYEYRCKKCDNKFEELQSLGAPCPPCPKCASNEVDKLFSTFGFSKEGKIQGGGKPSCSSCSGGNCSSC